MGISRLYNACFGKKECSDSFVFILAKSYMDIGQLLAKDERCSTSGSKIITRTKNQLKTRPKTSKVASIGFKTIKACS